MIMKCSLWTSIERESRSTEFNCHNCVSSSSGILQQSLLIEPESLVSLNLLVASAVSAFTIGAALSGLAVCWIMAHKPANHRHGNTSQSSIQRRDRSLLSNNGGMGGSVLSVTRQGGGERPCSQGGETLFVMPNGWVKSGELDPGFLPTPEHTPQQKRRGLRLSDSNSGGWDTSQTYLGGGSVGLGSPCRMPPSVYLTTRLFQQGGGGRHGGEGRGNDTPRQHYVCLSKQEKGGKGTPKAPLRKSAGEYVYPMTPQDSPERRRVVSAPSAPMEYGEPLPLRWPPHEGYILNSHGMVPVPLPPPSMPAPSSQAYVSHQHTPGLSRALLRGALERGELGELVDLSHLMSKKNCSDRTQTGQWLWWKWRSHVHSSLFSLHLFILLIRSIFHSPSFFPPYIFISLSFSPSDPLWQSLRLPPLDASAYRYDWLLGLPLTSWLTLIGRMDWGCCCVCIAEPLSLGTQWQQREGGEDGVKAECGAERMWTETKMDIALRGCLLCAD